EFYFAQDTHQQYLHKSPGGHDCHVRSGVACSVGPHATGARRRDGSRGRAPVDDLASDQIRVGSDDVDVLRLQALLALRDLEGDLLVLLERAVARAVDGREVGEDVSRAVVGGTEAHALVGVEPLDGTGSHDGVLLSCIDPPLVGGPGDAAESELCFPAVPHRPHEDGGLQKYNVQVQLLTRTLHGPPGFVIPTGVWGARRRPGAGQEAPRTTSASTRAWVCSRSVAA